MANRVWTERATPLQVVVILRDRVRSLGGTPLDERMDVPGTGWSDAFADPDGNTVGIVQYA